MSKKKRKRTKEPTSPLAGLLRRYPKWPRRIGVTAALVGVVVAIMVFADPFGGGPTAIDENGVEVSAGIIDGAPGARARPDSAAPTFLLPGYDQQAVALDDHHG